MGIRVCRILPSVLQISVRGASNALLRKGSDLGIGTEDSSVKDRSMSAPGYRPIGSASVLPHGLQFCRRETWPWVLRKSWFTPFFWFVLSAVPLSNAWGEPPAETGVAGNATRHESVSRSASVTSSLAVGRWAVIVGVSKHKNSAIDLKYGDRDAEALYELIQKPTAGGFSKDHILKLINEEATTASITKALRSFLKKPAPEDVVLLYFSCHGSPDPDRPDYVYLVTHDTDPNDISGTGLPMREVQWCLESYLVAKRVILLADTCHSGAIAGGGRKNLEPVNRRLVNDYLTLLAQSNPGTAMLTSAGANEVSIEDEKWGGGHGVFTHFLLEGMSGNADAGNSDGIVTVGELFDYVYQQVKEQTQDKQHPALGPHGFDREFPIAITSGVSGHLHLDLGTKLYQFGRQREETRLLRSAASHLGEAMRYLEGQEKERLEAIRLRGMAQLAAGDAKAAIASLTEARGLDNTAAYPEIDYYLGMAYATGQQRTTEEKQRNDEQAIEALKRFVTTVPNHENAAWSKQTISQLEERQTDAGKCYALLAGTNQYGSGINALRGPENDVRLMQSVLSRLPQWRDGTIIALLGKDAISSQFVAKLQELKTALGKADKLLVYFSGMSMRGEDFLVFADTSISQGKLTNGIGGDDLHRLLMEVPASTWLILDAEPNSHLEKLASAAKKYTVLWGCSPNEHANESKGANGHFTTHLAKAMEEHSNRSFTNGELQQEALRGMNGVLPTILQTPMLIGDSQARFLEKSGGPSDWFKLSQRWTFPELPADAIESTLKFASEKGDKLPPELELRLVNALLARGEYPRVVSFVDQLRPIRGGPLAREAELSLGRVQLRRGQYAEAASSLDVWIAGSDLQPEDRQIVGQALASVREASAAPADAKFALLVGIDDYTDESVAVDIQGAVNDVRAMKEALTERLGIPAANIKVLEGSSATRAAIIEEFRKLADRSRWSPTLFYFAGYGSRSAENRPTIVSVDGRTEGVFDIELAELAALCPRAPISLVSIFDAGWTDFINRDEESAAQAAKRSDRYLTADLRQRPKAGDRAIQSPDHVSTRPEGQSFALQVGRHTIFSGSIDLIRESNHSVEIKLPPIVSHAQQPMIHGKLTHALVSCLREEGNSVRTYKDWMDAAAKKLQSKPYVAVDPPSPAGREWNTWLKARAPHLASGDMHELILTHGAAVQRVEDSLVEIDKRRMRGCIEQLTSLAANRSDLAGEAKLDAGILAALIGDYERSLADLRVAVDHAGALGQRDRAERHYHYGRTLYESAQPSEVDLAVSELRRAVEQDPTNGRARLYLGRAIRRLIERNLRGEAEKQFQDYLAAGAPLGDREEVQRFLSGSESAGDR